MKRRALLAVALASLAGLGLALAPWTISSGSLARRVAHQVREGFGLELEVSGRTSVALLPVPRVRLEGVSLKEPGGTPLVRGGGLRGELNLLALLAGRVELNEVTLVGSRIDVALGGDGPTSWDGVAATVLRRAREAGSLPPVRRLVLTNSTIMVQDRAGDGRSVVRDVNLVANWAGGRDGMEVGGSFAWRDERVQIALTEFQPGVVLAGGASPVELRLTSGVGRLTVLGTADGGAGPWLSGRSAVETRSLRDLLHWSGLRLPLGEFIDVLTLDGEFTLDRRSLAWPAVRLMVGPDRLDGALSARAEDGRVAIAGTLAAERLNLSRFGTPVLRAAAPAGIWSAEPADLAGLTRADLDLRLSATAGRVGPLRFEDLALSVLVKPNRIEATLGRASVNGGRVKGRLALLGGTPTGLDLKAQGSFERLELGGLLGDLGHGRWIAGPAGGQLVVEAAGASPAELVARATGRVSVGVRGGELMGVAFGDALRRFERTPLAASLDWRGGRTPFDQAGLMLTIANGLGHISEGGFSSPSVRGRLEGRISLLEQTLSARALVEPSGSPAGRLSPALAFEITGPWNHLALTPDAKALIQRSNAAQTLAAPEPLRLPLEPVRESTAQ